MSDEVMHDPDEEHLRILAICEYVLAGLTVLISCCPGFYMAFGLAMVFGAFDNDPNPPPPQLGLFLSGGAGLATLYCWFYAALELFTAHSFHHYRRYRFCFVMACIELLNAPFGTALGVFMIIVLCRPSVHALFMGIRYRDPRLDALDDFDDDERNEAPPTSGSGDDTVREGTPPAKP